LIFDYIKDHVRILEGKLNSYLESLILSKKRGILKPFMPFLSSNEENEEVKISESLLIKLDMAIDKRKEIDKVLMQRRKIIDL
jgi:hypothetical protein